VIRRIKAALQAVAVAAALRVIRAVKPAKRPAVLWIGCRGCEQCLAVEVTASGPVECPQVQATRVTPLFNGPGDTEDSEPN
jgi:Ni,Fe-hydrogenase I small subunit